MSRDRVPFQFSAVELMTLALSFTVTSVLVFLLGFYVGKRIAAGHGGGAEQVARVPVGEAPADATPFASRFGSRPVEAPSVTPPASAPSTRPAASPESARKPAAPVLARPLEEHTGGESRPLPLPPAPEPIAAAAPAPPPPAAEPTVPYTVQVLATRNRREADDMVRRLKDKRVGAYVAEVEDAGGAWYRVRIGRYDSPEAARRVAERCQRELGLTQAYVSPVHPDVR